MLRAIGRKISRIGDLIQEPRLVAVRLRGIEVRMFEALNKRWLLDAGVNTIVDVGANIGQFAQAIHAVLPQARIYSFEPLADCFAKLEKKMQNVPNFQAFNVALGETRKEAEFYRSAWSPSSSLLPMGTLHKQSFPFSAGERLERVQVCRLDDYVGQLTTETEILVKIDVQGAEDQVIRGGKEFLKRAKIMIVETSTGHLYQGQPLFADILKLLEALGFVYHGALAQGLSPIDGTVLYADSVFLRAA